MNLAPVRNVPPPQRVKIAEPIRLLKIGESIFFEGGSGTSIKSVLTKLRGEFESKRRFTSKKEDGGVRVWRLP